MTVWTTRVVLIAIWFAGLLLSFFVVNRYVTGTVNLPELGVVDRLEPNQRNAVADSSTTYIKIVYGSYITWIMGFVFSSSWPLRRKSAGRRNRTSHSSDTASHPKSVAMELASLPFGSERDDVFRFILALGCTLAVNVLFLYILSRPLFDDSHTVSIVDSAKSAGKQAGLWGFLVAPVLAWYFGKKPANDSRIEPIAPASDAVP